MEGLLSPESGPAAANFVRFSTAEGLPGNNTTCLTTDTEGFLWVGTMNGLARFDGRRFSAFRTLSPGTSLPDEPVEAIFADGAQMLWVKFAKGLYQMSLTTFHAVRCEQNLLPHCADDTGNIYFSYPEGVAMFRKKQGDFQWFPLVVQGKKVSVSLICKGKKGLLLVTSAEGMFRFDTRNHTYERLNALHEAAGNIFQMASDADGMLWVSIWYDRERGFVHYDPYQDKVLRAFGAEKRGISNTDLNDIYPDGENVWMATNSGGLCRYAIREDRFYCYPANAGAPGSLWSNQLSRITKDRFGNLWVATPFFLFQLPAHSTTTGLLTHDPQKTNSLIAPKAAALLALSGNQLVFGTAAGLSIFDRKKQSFLNVRLPTYNDNDYNNQLICLTPADPGRFWAATWSVLYRLDAQSGRVVEYYITHPNAGKKHPEAVKRFELKTTRRMCKDRAGVLWMVDFNNRVIRSVEDGPTRLFERVDTLVADTNPQNDRVESFLDYDEHYLLLGTLDGLVRYNRVAGRFEACPVTFPGLSAPVKIMSLARSQNGDVLLIANGKPFRVHLSAVNTTAMPLPLPDDLFQGQHIVEDQTGSVWVTTENGLAQINEAADFCWFYDSGHYLHDNIFLMRPSVAPILDGDGNLYFGGSRGVSMLRPLDFKVRKTPPPPVRIIALHINDQPAALDTAIHRATMIRLPYDQNNLSFTFSALHSPIPERNRFAYRLDGGAWVDLGTQNSVNFSRLAPGTYTLQVKAANSDGVWNEEGARLRITILPPWWRSWPAYLGYLILMGLALRRYLQFRVKRLQMAHQLEAERREAERLQELDNFKSHFFTNISHEFRTPLTVILGMTERMTDNGKRLTENEIAHSLGLIKRSGQNLLRLINQILDLAKLESGKLTLQLEQADMVAFSRYVVESLQSLSALRNIQLHFEAENEEVLMDFDLEKMQAILFNLLSNALKFTPEGGHVYLQVSRTEETCQITVRDTGIGIPAEKLGRIFDRFYRVGDSTTRKGEGTGIGLALARELARLMGGDISVESRIDAGTCFEVVLPVRTEHTIAAVQTPAMNFDFAPGTNIATGITESAEDGEKPTLLLVEDNDDVRQYLVACVSDQYRVMQAHNGREGIEKALEHTPDLIISDVMMPEKDGFELCQTLKNDERSSHIPIVLLTAKASVESRIAGLSRGADVYLAKPFHREELMLTVANLLQSRRVMQERLRAALMVAQTATDIPNAATPVAPEFLPVLETEDAFVQKLRQYVEENISNTELSMEELSRAMTMSYQNLHRKLTALTSLAPVQFIRLIRLQKAKVLLQTTRRPIGEIAFEVGFNDPKYFSRVFTEEFGRPPSAVREGTEN